MIEGFLYGFGLAFGFIFALGLIFTALFLFTIYGEDFYFWLRSFRK